MAQNKTRKGTIDEGKVYEWHVAAIISLKLLLNKKVSDFAIEINLAGLGALDDVVITLKTQNEEKISIAMQIKHIEDSKKKFPLDSLDAPTGRFALNAYFKDFFTLPVNKKPDYFILLTTAGFDENKCKKNQLKNIEIEKKNCPIEEYLDLSSNNSFGFSAKEEGAYNDFLAITYLWPSQLNRWKTEKKIEEIWQKLLGQNYKIYFNGFLEYFRKRYLGDYKLKLTKEMLSIKIFEILLDDSMIIPEIIKNVDDDKYGIYKLCQNVLGGFQLTILDNHRIGATWKIIFDIDDVSYVNAAKELDLLEKNHYINDLNDKIKMKVASFQYGVPILISVTDVNRTLIDFIYNQIILDIFPVVLIGDYQLKNDNIVPFVYMSQLNYKNHELFLNICDVCYVSLQGRPVVKLKQLLSYDINLIYIFTMNEIFDGSLINQHCDIGEPKEELPSPYIFRYVPLKYIMLHDLKDIREICIIDCHKYFEAISENLSTLRIEYSIIRSQSNIINIGENNIFLTSNFNQEIFRNIHNSLIEKNKKYGQSSSESNTVHHLTAIDFYCLKWNWTRGSSNNLKKLVKNKLIPENEIFEKFRGSTNVISAVPGMGKTVILKHLRNNCPLDYWVIKLNFQSIANILNDSTIDCEKIINYYFDTILGNYNKITRDIFGRYLFCNRIMLLWDGLDELRSDDLIKKGLLYVREFEKKGWKQWVCSRTHLLQIIENTLETFAITIEEFKEEDQKTYIIERLQHRTPQDVEVIKNWIFENFNLIDNREILGIPLQLYMITEIYKKDIIEEKIKFQTLTTIYEKFLEIKLNKYHNLTKDYSVNYLLNKYQVVALLTVIKTDDLQISMTENLFDDYNEKYEEYLSELKSGDPLGIVINCNCSTKSVEFAHISYGEYLVASWMAKNIKLKYLKSFKNFIFNENYRNIRFLFDLILTDNRKELVDILYRKNKDIDPKLIDKAGRTPQHLLCSWGYYHPNLDYIFRKSTFDDTYYYICLSSDSNLQTNDKNSIKDDMEIGELLTDYEMEVDPLFEFSPIQYANASRSLAIIEGMASKIQIPINDLDIFKDTVTILYFTLINGYKNIADEYIDILPIVYYNFDLSMFIALKSHNLEIAKSLFEKFNDEKEFLLKHLALCSIKSSIPDSFFVSKFFERTGIEEDDVCDISNEAIDRNNFEIIKYLVENKKFQMSKSIMFYLYNWEQVSNEIFQYLVDNDYGAQLMELAINDSYLPLIKFLIEEAKFDLHTINDDKTYLKLLQIYISRGLDQFEDKQTILAILKIIKNVLGTSTFLSTIINSYYSSDDRYFLIEEFYFLGDNLDEKYFDVKINIRSKDSDYSVIVCWKNHKIGDLLLTVTLTEETKQNAMEFLSEKTYNSVDAVKLFEHLTQYRVGIIWGDSKIDDTLLMTTLRINQEFGLIKYLVEECQIDVNAQNTKGETVLSISISNNMDLNIVDYLVENGADVNWKHPKTNNTLLISSLENHGDLTLIQYLIQKCKIDINIKNNNEETALSIACTNQKTLDVIKYLVENGADLTWRDPSTDDTLLTTYLKNFEYFEIIQYLITECKIDVNIKNKNGESALSLACETGKDLNVIKYLIESGGDLNWKNPKTNDTLLMIYLKNIGSSLAVIQYLVENGIDINAENNEGETALSIACIWQFSNVDFVKYLIEHGANIQWRDRRSDDTLLMQCLKKETDIEIIRYLVEECQVDVNAKNIRGATAFCADSYCRYDMHNAIYMLKMSPFIMESTRDLNNLDPGFYTNISTNLGTWRYYIDQSQKKRNRRRTFRQSKFCRTT